MLWSFTSRGGVDNTGQLFKSGPDKPQYTIAFDDGVPPSITINTAVTLALNSAGVNTTNTCVSNTTISGTSVSINMLTCGAGGNTAAADGGRFQLITTATLSNSDVLTFSTYILIQAPTYAPV